METLRATLDACIEKYEDIIVTWIQSLTDKEPTADAELLQGHMALCGEYDIPVVVYASRFAATAFKGFIETDTTHTLANFVARSTLWNIQQPLESFERVLTVENLFMQIHGQTLTTLPALTAPPTLTVPSTLITPLKNLGNTCFLNAALQSLLWLNTTGDQSTPFRRAFAQFVGSGSSNTNRDITTFHAAVRQYLPRLGDYQQHDAHEAWNSMVDLLYSSSDNNSADHPYKLTLAETRKSKCSQHDTESTNEQITTHLSAFLPDTPTSIEELLRLETWIEKVDDYRCSHCGKVCDTQRQRRIIPEGNVFAIHLVRFTHDGKKNNVPVELNPKIKVANIAYELSCVINHTGDVGGGHYTATYYDGAKAYLCNDASVREILPCELTQTQPYMVFYKRV